MRIFLLALAGITVATAAHAGSTSATRGGMVGGTGYFNQRSEQTNKMEQDQNDPYNEKDGPADPNEDTSVIDTTEDSNGKKNAK